MVKIRLTRAGSKKRPFYRVTAIDERKPRDGRPLAFLGPTGRRASSAKYAWYTKLHRMAMSLPGCRRIFLPSTELAC